MHVDVCEGGGGEEGGGACFSLRQARITDQDSSESHDCFDRASAQTEQMAGCSRTLSAFAGGQTRGPRVT